MSARTGLVAGLVAVTIAAGSTLVPADPVTMLDQERAVWSQLDRATRAHYCDQPRPRAVREYGDAIAEGPHADHATRLARAVLAEGCAR